MEPVDKKELWQNPEQFIVSFRTSSHIASGMNPNGYQQRPLALKQAISPFERFL